MGTFGAEFINVATPPRDFLTSQVRPLEPGSTIPLAWFSRINEWAELRQGAVLYFPPGEWIVEPVDPTAPSHPSQFRWSVEEFRTAVESRNLTALDDLYRRTNENPWNADVILDERVSLWMSAGAFLRLRSGVRLVVKGTIQAEDLRIFEEEGGSMLIPASNAMSSLKATWWGVGTDPTVDDSSRLERAIEAATARRRAWRAWYSSQTLSNGSFIPDVITNKVLPSLPLILAGEIALARTVHAGERDPFGLNALFFRRPPGWRLKHPLPTTVLLRGIANGRRRPSALIRTHPSFVDDTAQGGSALISLSLPRATILQGIAFDGNDRASRCLELTAQFQDRDMQEVAIRMCSFTGARGSLLQIGPPPEGASGVEATTELRDDLGLVGERGLRARVIVPVTAPGRAYPRYYPDPANEYTGNRAAFPSTDLSGLSISSCEFDVRSTAAEPVACSLRSGQALPVTISDCHFTGDANAFISAVAGTALVEGCTFRNTRVPLRRKPISPNDGTTPLRVGFESSDGADVELALDVVDAFRVAPFQPGDAPIAGVMVLASLSQSACVLSTGRPSPFTPQRYLRSTTLLGCRQERPVGDRVRSADPDATPESIRWGVSRQSENPVVSAMTPKPTAVQRRSSDVGLCVVGCALESPIGVYLGATAVSVLSVSARSSPRRAYRFLPVATRISRQTLILGFAALLALVTIVGCRSGTAPADASTADRTALDIPTPGMDGTSIKDAKVVMDEGDAAEPEDAAATELDASVENDSGRHDAADASDASSAPDIPDNGVIRYASLGPPRQMRHNCPAVTDGDPAIPAPRLIYPLSGTRATSRRPGFRWELAAGTTGARVEVCADPCCARVITAYDAEGTTRRPAEMLPPGVVWWRARGRTAMGYGRATSFTWEVGIKRRDAPIDSAWGTLRDVNGDGYDDIVTTAEVNYVVRLYTIFGSPSGPRHNLSAFQNHPEMGFGGRVLFGDFNGDGLADLVFSTSPPDRYFGSDLAVVEGTPAGYDLQRSRLFESSSGARSTADVNGDGFQDLVLSQRVLQNTGVPRDGPRMVLYGGSGVGSGGMSVIGDEVIGGIPPPHGYNTATNTVGDLNGDGYADILIGDRARGRILVLRGSANGPEYPPVQVLQNPLESSEGFGGVVSLLGDINGDSLPEFCVYLGDFEHLVIYRGDRTRMAILVDTLSVPRSGRPPGGLRTGFGPTGPGPDLDGDGRAELVVGCEWCNPGDGGSGLGAIYQYAMDEADNLGLVRQVSMPGAARFGASARGVGDVDGDGFDELAVATAYSSNMLFLFFGGDAGLSTMRVVSLSGPPERLYTDEISFGILLARGFDGSSVTRM